METKNIINNIYHQQHDHDKVFLYDFLFSGHKFYFLDNHEEAKKFFQSIC
jgi:hypothetical protein